MGQSLPYDNGLVIVIWPWGAQQVRSMRRDILEILGSCTFERSASRRGTGDPVWTRLYHFFSYNQQWFSEHYHKRSNSESTNAMIKMKFGERLRSKTEVAQFNELLCKVLCHNICVTIQSTYGLGIQPTCPSRREYQGYAPSSVECGRGRSLCGPR